MIKVHAAQILGNPQATSQRPEESCPECGEACFGFEDGSIRCDGHGCFAPQPTDLRLFRRRQDFDARFGITANDRLALADKLEEHAMVAEEFERRKKGIPLAERTAFRDRLAGIEQDALAERDRINEHVRLTRLGQMPRL